MCKIIVFFVLPLTTEVSLDQKSICFLINFDADNRIVQNDTQLTLESVVGLHPLELIQNEQHSNFDMEQHKQFEVIVPSEDLL